MPFEAAPNKAIDLPSRSCLAPHRMFESQVDRSPGNLAIDGETGTLTYAELEQRANQIAHALHAAGVKRGEFVGVFLERGVDLVCALLGTLKAGAAFVVLEPRAPGVVLARELATVPVPFLLTHRRLTSALPAFSGKLLCLDEPGWLSRQSVERPVLNANPRDPACVLFTSGSRGYPKAVLYLHQNLAVRFSNSTQIVGLEKRSVFAQTSPITSIDAIDEMFLPLVSGGRAAILLRETVANPHQLVAQLSSHRVTHILLVPSLLRVILLAERDLDRKLETLRTWIVGGEQLPGLLTSEFYRKLPNAVLINFYGLTEGDASYYITSPAREYGFNTPVGHGVPGTKIYLLDELLKPVAPGTIGEIYLAGPALFHEYVNCPELNEKRWVDNPFVSGDADLKMFRTGDRGRLGSEGELEYLGRGDRMVKLRGLRVELGEVEAILCQHPAVEQGVVVAKQPNGANAIDLRHEPYLVAYVILKAGYQAASADLHNFLKYHLPECAVPAMVTILGVFPLSPNGKIDGQALSMLDGKEREFCKNYIPPRSPLESRLIKMWEELLQYQPIGVVDSFFEIGGDSRAATDLMQMIEKEFHCSLPMTALMQSPTVAALAEGITNLGTSR